MRLRVDADKENLWQAVREAQLKQPSYCGGRGSCGKCRVRVLNGEASVSSADRAFLTEQEIREGMRIACQSSPLTECEIEPLMVDEEQLKVLTVEAEEKRGQREPGSSSYSVAVDIGTTTLAFALVDEEGRIIATEQGLNHQRCLGADVVSRIEQALKGREKELIDCIRRDIRQGIRTLIEKQDLAPGAVRHIAVAGNTTMEQLFFGLSVEGLGKYPFEPAAAKQFMKSSYQKLFPGQEAWEQRIEDIPVTGFPCIAGFVGGDITAGLYELTSDKLKGLTLFLDIGTNGELACIRGDRIVTASTAAGPVFEGGAISCGIGCVPGAVCATKIREDMLECRTIDGVQAAGICGSGLIEAVSDMLELGIVNPDGLMKSVYQKQGYLLARTKEGKAVSLTQEDIREFQMAKAAIAAGEEMLLKKLGASPSQVSEYLLAGGFGSGLSMAKAVKTGLLPKNARGKTRTVGNTSLKGVIRFLREGEAGRKRIEELLGKTEHLHLAAARDFEECYIRHMNF